MGAVVEDGGGGEGEGFESVSIGTAADSSSSLLLSSSRASCNGRDACQMRVTVSYKHRRTGTICTTSTKSSNILSKRSIRSCALRFSRINLIRSSSNRSCSSFNLDG